MWCGECSAAVEGDCEVFEPDSEEREWPVGVVGRDRNVSRLSLVRSPHTIQWDDIAKSIGYLSAEDASTASSIMITYLTTPSSPVKTAKVQNKILEKYIYTQIEAKLQEKLLERADLKADMNQNYADSKAGHVYEEGDGGAT